MSEFEDLDKKDADEISTDEVRRAIDNIKKKKHSGIDEKVRKVMSERDERFPRSGSNRREHSQFPHTNQDVSKEGGGIIKIPKGSVPVGAAVGILIVGMVGINSYNKALREEIRNEFKVEIYRINQAEKRLDRHEAKLEVLGKAINKP